MNSFKKLTLISAFVTLVVAAARNQADSLAGRIGIDGGGAFFEIRYRTATPLQDNPDLRTDVRLGCKADNETASNGEVDFRHIELVGVGR